jgi:hypothetical protein
LTSDEKISLMQFAQESMEVWEPWWTIREDVCLGIQSEVELRNFNAIEEHEFSE